MPNYRGTGAWGPGTGAPLTQPQFDGNTFEFDTRLTELETNPPAANGIASIEVAATAMTITLDGGQELGPFAMPVLMFRWRGDWAPFTLQAVLDSFKVDGSGLYVSLRDHTTAATFDPDAVGPAVTAGDFVVGTVYRIATVGTTDFIAIGASENTIGIDFKATGAGTGTGTATPKTYHQLIGTGSNTALDELLDVDVAGAIADDMIVAVSVGSPATIEWQNRNPTQVTALLTEFSGDTGSPGGGVKGLVPAPADGDAAAGKFLSAGGGWSVVTSGINELTGDVTAGPGTGSQVATLATVNASPGTYTLATVTVNAKGLATAVSDGTGSSISDLPLATLPVAALSLIEISETDGGSPAIYTSKHIRISDLVHTLGSTSIAMGATVTTIAGLALTGVAGLGIRDASAAFDVTLAAVSAPALSAGRTLTLDMSNVAHTLDFGATANTITFPSAASYTLAALGVAGTWSATQTSMTLSGASLTGATTLTGSGSITAAGELGLGAAPVARLYLGGTYTTANSDLSAISGTHASSVTTTQRLLNINATLAPSGASLTNIFSVSIFPTLNSTAFTINEYRGIHSTISLGASFSGAITTANLFLALDPTISGGSIATLNGFRVGPFTNGNGLAAGTVSNHGFQIQAATAGSNGGTVLNRSLYVEVPSGGSSAGTTDNRGIYITGNGGTASGSPPGTVNNYAIYSGSIAASRLDGNLTIRAATAIPAGGTAGAGFMVSSTANFGVFFGSGAPTLSAAKGSFYLRSDGSATNNRAYINTDGGTTWTALTTAA